MPRSAAKTASDFWSHRKVRVLFHGFSKYCMRLQIGDVTATLNSRQADQFVSHLLTHSGYEVSPSKGLSRIRIGKKADRKSVHVNRDPDTDKEVFNIYQHGDNPIWVGAEARIPGGKRQELVDWLAPRLGWDLN